MKNAEQLRQIAEARRLQMTGNLITQRAIAEINETLLKGATVIGHSHTTYSIGKATIRRLMMEDPEVQWDAGNSTIDIALVKKYYTDIGLTISLESRGVVGDICFEIYA